MKQRRYIDFVILSFFLLPCFLSADVPRTLYTVNGSAETVSKLELDSKTITQNIAQTGQIPNKIMAHGELLFILDSGTSDIKILDPRTDQIVRTIALQPGANPWDMEFVGPNRVYVSNWVANTVSVLDLESGTIVKEIAVGKGPEDILILNNQAFVTNSGYAGWGVPYEQGTVNIIDVLTDAVVDTLAVPTNPQKAALAPDGKIHVLCTGDYENSYGSVAVIELLAGPDLYTPAVLDTIKLGGAPGDLEITASGKAYAVDWGTETNGLLYAYDAWSGSVSHNVENPIKIGPNVSRILYDARENCLWIPYMQEWGGDGFVQKFDVALDSVIWVSDVMGNGTSHVTVLDEIEDTNVERERKALPGEFVLLQNYPNPFNPSTTIRFITSAAGPVSLDIFNPSGQWVRSLVNQRMDVGTHAVQWDGLNQKQQPASSGVYLARLKMGETTKSIKMILVR